uniref:Uncharacterized protein n=1 Tax=Coccidioides posadasii RMSCC 3488 TaxID=454284 RepID=A0A0J6FHZ3_COCPO|nr:hypothetical protein CPAG_05318 [Coccidioides posadasii RMSCC 3488]
MSRKDSARDPASPSPTKKQPFMKPRPNDNPEKVHGVKLGKEPPSGVFSHVDPTIEVKFSKGFVPLFLDPFSRSDPSHWNVNGSRFLGRTRQSGLPGSRAQASLESSLLFGGSKSASLQGGQNDWEPRSRLPILEPQRSHTYDNSPILRRIVASPHFHRHMICAAWRAIIGCYDYGPPGMHVGSQYRWALVDANSREAHIEFDCTALTAEDASIGLLIECGKTPLRATSSI